MRIFLGLLLLVIGPLITIKFEAVHRNIGDVPFAEKWMGSGSSRFFIQLMGTLIAFLGLVILFNLHGKFILWIFGPIIPNN